MNTIIPGINSCLELLENSYNTFIEVNILKDNNNPRINLIKSICLKKEILINEIDSKSLNQISADNQGVVSILKEKTFLNQDTVIKKFEDSDNSLLLILDNILDVRNLGSILRTTECFNVDSIILPKNRSAALNPTVHRTSMGASYIKDITYVNNLLSFITILQKNGYWVVSADCNDSSTSLYEFDFPAKTALILGSEDKGIQKKVLEASDFIVHIPMLGNFDSVNVSISSGIFLSHYRRSFKS